jgi:hypothetical protein
LDFTPTGTTDLSLLDATAAAAADDDAAVCPPLALDLPLPSVYEFTGPAMFSLMSAWLGLLADAALGAGTGVGFPIFCSSVDFGLGAFLISCTIGTLGPGFAFALAKFIGGITCVGSPILFPDLDLVRRFGGSGGINIGTSGLSTFLGSCDVGADGINSSTLEVGLFKLAFTCCLFKACLAAVSSCICVMRVPRSSAALIISSYTPVCHNEG